MPLASEVPPPSSNRHNDIVKFNNDVVWNSNGAIPPTGEEEFVTMSVAKSHSSMASRCVLLESPHSNEKLTENGILSLHKIKSLRPEYGAAIEHRLIWDVVCWQVEEQYPAVMELLQEAGSLTQTTCLEETRWQVALKMYQSAERMIAEEGLGAADIANAVEHVASSGAPKFKSELKDLHVHIQNMAGDSGVILKESLAFVVRKHCLLHE